MRILYLHQYFNTPRNIGGTRSYEMARRLVARGHTVNIVTSERGGNEAGGWRVTEEEGIYVHWLPVPYSNKMPNSKRIAAFIRFARSAATYAAATPSDVVFATSTPLTIALPAVWAKRKQRVPMVFEVRDLWPELPIAIGALRSKPQIQAAQMLERFAYRNSAAIVALSPGMKEGIVRTGYPAEKVTVIPNSCDLDMFDVPASSGAAFRSRYEWLQDRPLVLYAGTLGKINGVAYLAEIAAKALPLDPEIRFLVVGEGAEEEIVRNRALELNVLDRNFFLLPPVAKSEMPQLFSAATISLSLFVDLKEMWANSANKFFDGLAAGKPVAINYGGWQAELLQESGAGFVLPATDAATAAKVLTAAARDVPRLVSASKSAKHLAQTRFNRDMLAGQLEEVLLRGSGK